MELDRKFEVNLDQFNGPLDLLLDLAKSQKVNLENISITLLADQFLDYINKVKNLIWYYCKPKPIFTVILRNKIPLLLWISYYSF